jgi:hypothetical protein
LRQNLGFSNGAVPVIPTSLSAPNGPGCRGNDQSLTAMNPGLQLHPRFRAWSIASPVFLRLADEFDCLAVLGEIECRCIVFSTAEKEKASIRAPPPASTSSIGGRQGWRSVICV